MRRSALNTGGSSGRTAVSMMGIPFIDAAPLALLGSPTGFADCLRCRSASEVSKLIHRAIARFSSQNSLLPQMLYGYVSVLDRM